MHKDHGAPERCSSTTPSQWRGSRSKMPLATNIIQDRFSPWPTLFLLRLLPSPSLYMQKTRQPAMRMSTMLLLLTAGMLLIVWRAPVAVDDFSTMIFPVGICRCNRGIASSAPSVLLKSLMLRGVASVRSGALHTSMSHITLLYLIFVHHMHSQCPRSILPTCSPSLLVKDVAHWCLSRPGDALRFHAYVKTIPLLPWTFGPHVAR